MKKSNVTKKVVLSCLVVALVIGLSYLAYYLIRYTFYDEYKDYLVGTTYAEGSEFTAKSDTNRPEDLAEGFVLAEENDYLKLYYNEDTTEVAVYDKTKNTITYSNPQNITEADYANKTYFSNMQSQLIVYYYKAAGETSRETMTSYDYCTNIELTSEEQELQYSVEKIENGIRVIYQIGDLSSETGSVPTYISKATFDDIIKQLQDYDEANGTRYTKEIKNVYTESKNVDDFYELNSGVKKRKMATMQEILEEVCNWTTDDYIREMDASGTEYSTPLYFTIPLEYTLVDGKLQVNICTDHIEEGGGAALIYIDVLPYFGAEYYQTETGNYTTYVYEVDETATDGVAVKTVDENVTTVYDSEAGNATVTFNTAGFAPEDSYYNNCTVYEIESDEYGLVSTDADGNYTSSAAPVATLSSYNGYSFTADLDVDYFLKVDSYGSEGNSTQTYKFVVGPETENAEGYYLVPNGSGSLINLNSVNCDGVSDYTESVYGKDDVMFDTEISVQETESVKLPVYGLHTSNRDMFVIISRGESLAELHVQTANDKTCKQSSSLTNYNTAYARYYLRAENEIQMSSADSFIVWNDDIFDTQITQLYCFLSDDYSGYSGMANYYREYLEEKGDLEKSESTEEADTELYIDLIGAVKGDAQLLGITYESVIPMTTFSQAEEIVNCFYDKDIKNLVINYQGWMNDGYYHETVDNIDVISKLGGESGLESFTNLVESNGGKVYGDMAILKVSYAADEYPETLESARIYGAGYVAAYGKSGPTTYSNSASVGYKANLYDVLSSKYVPRYVKASVDEMNKLTLSGTSYRDLGTVVYSDMRKTNVISRESSKEIIEAMLKYADENASNNGTSIMLNAPLAYALAYADEIINAPIGDNNYTYVDTEVPFYEMVIHGFINYSGSAINLSADTTSIENILECVEYGASPHFTLTYEAATDMKYTALNDKYATNYVNWIDEASTIYTEVNTALSKVASAEIVSHEIVEGSNNLVKKITYSNGVVIYVNYSTSAFTVDGIQVPAKDFVIQ